MAEIIEFIRRDILNMAMKNTDNHARNTSVQRLADGTIRLCPLYDFAPMYLDREMILRTCRWSTAERHDIANMDEIVDTLPLSGAAKNEVASGLHDFAISVSRLPEIMDECGVDREIIEDCRAFIEAQFQRLDKIKGHGQTP